MPSTPDQPPTLDPRPPRVNVNIRLAPAAIAQVDKLADAEERTRSEMLRILLRDALASRAAGHLPSAPPARRAR